MFEHYQALRKWSCMVKGLSVVIMARPGPLREGLTTLLWALPPVASVVLAEDSASGLRAVERGHPALILLDAGLPDKEIWSALHQIKRRWPQTPCVVLTDTAERQHQAEVAGAHQALLMGFPAAQLSTILEQLLQQAI
jgi:DNA-binding NarL/FixJ family response regulator